MFSLSFVYLLYLFISHFGFKSGIWLLIAPVPVHCFSITFLDRLHKWELQWGMEVSPSWYIVIHVTRARPQTVNADQSLESFRVSNYLGVGINDNRFHDNHIQTICTSASRPIGFFKRKIRTKSAVIREMAYKALVRLLIEFR